MWKTGDSLGIRLEQVGEGAKTEAEIDAMLAHIGQVVEVYGFKVRQWGEWTKMCQSMANELQYIEQLATIHERGNR